MDRTAIEVVKDQEPEVVTSFPVGAAIPFSYTEITFAGNKPNSLSGLTFHATLVDKITREVKGTVVHASMSVNDNGGDPFVSFSLDTDGLSGMKAGYPYEYDFWVVDPASGKHRLDSILFMLDTPETTTFP